MIRIKSILLSLAIALLSISAVHAQETRTIKGRIVSEDFETLPGVKIFNMDTTELGSTDLEGYFEAEIPLHTDKFLLGLVGFEWMTVKIEDKNCSTFEMIMMNSVIYDFIPMKKVNKKRRKRFNNLSKKHKEAFEQGLFQLEDTSCVCYVFSEH